MPPSKRPFVLSPRTLNINGQHAVLGQSENAQTLRVLDLRAPAVFAHERVLTNEDKNRR